MSSQADEFRIREARADDHEDVLDITADTWDGDDYLGHVYHDWLEGENRRTLVATVDEQVVGIAQVVVLSEHEAWGQGLRVAPEHRGKGIGDAVTYDLFDWAHDRGAVVARAMVFSWNQAGLGQARAVGYDPVTEFRWLHPDPTPDRDPSPAPSSGNGQEPVAVEANPDAAWSYWTRSGAREHLGGLALSMDESWALQELTRGTLRRAADETALLAAVDDGTRGFSYRTRTFEHSADEQGETERWAEYGVAAWEDGETARTLLGAIAADAAAVGADRTRVLVPETARFVSDGALLRANIGDEPDFVLAADLTARYRD